MKYFYDFAEEEKANFNPEVTSSRGAKVVGERIIVGLVDKPRGTGSRPHRHESEQFNYVIKGKLQATVEGEEKTVGPGGLIHIPANALHSIIATPEEDVVFYVCKDTAGFTGVPEDGEKTGPRFVPGFEDKAKIILNTKK